MVRVLATLAVGMLMIVGPFGIVGAASAETGEVAVPIVCSAEDGGCGQHCPTDIHNYLWRLGDWLRECER